MKKMIFAVAAMVAATLSAFQVVQPTVEADGRLTAQAGGKLVRVIAVSPTVAAGTVNLEAVYSAAPTADTFLSGVDTLYFTGTAISNGFLRLVFE